MVAAVVYAYTVAAVLGLVLLAASLLGAGHDHDVGHTDSADHESPVFALLSARVWTYLLTFGGLTGLLLRFVTPVAEPWRAMFALGGGIVAAALARGLIARASRRGPSGTVKRAELVGCSASVIVPFQSGSTGKVRVHVAESDVDLLAMTDEGDPLGNGEEVIVVELRDDGAVVVTRAPR
jgi:membrane protein implicated in regulation of membrane protease activity